MILTSRTWQMILDSLSCYILSLLTYQPVLSKGNTKQGACRPQESSSVAIQHGGFVLLPSAVAPVCPLFYKVSSNIPSVPVKFRRKFPSSLTLLPWSP